MFRVFSLLLFLTLFIFGATNKKIIIDLTQQMAYAYEGKILIYKGWISSGKRGFRTPTGKFRILQKDIDHVSNEWPSKKGGSIEKDGGAKMPYMLRLTWSGIALHAGHTPNYPASHGCIRLQKAFAKKLYFWSKIGTRVIIKGKAPKRVVRKERSFTDYIALAKAKKLKKRRKIYLAKLSKREKLVRYYSKFSYKKLNKILRKNYRKEKIILASKSKNRYAKLRELKKIKWMVNILKDAKYKRYKRLSRYKKFVKKKRYINIKKRV